MHVCMLMREPVIEAFRPFPQLTRRSRPFMASGCV